MSAVRDCRDLQCRAHGRMLRRIRRLVLAVAQTRAENDRLRNELNALTATDEETS